MSLNLPTSPALSCWKSVFRTVRQRRSQIRLVSAATLRYRTPPPVPPRGVTSTFVKEPYVIKTYLPLPSYTKICSEPLKAFQNDQLGILDPSGARTRLFAKDNPDRACVGDVLLVRFKSGEPFAGVCMNIRRRGIDTAILLRNSVTRIGTELWVKVYSPLVVGIEIVQRVAKRARRARLTYLRQPKHDRGDLSGVVAEYMRTRRALGAAKKEKNKSGASSPSRTRARTR